MAWPMIRISTAAFNRRFYPFNAFRSLLGIASDAKAPTDAQLYSGDCCIESRRIKQMPGRHEDIALASGGMVPRGNTANGRGGA